MIYGDASSSQSTTIFIHMEYNSVHVSQCCLTLVSQYKEPSRYILQWHHRNSGEATGGLDGALHRGPQAQEALGTRPTKYKFNYLKILPPSEYK